MMFSLFGICTKTLHRPPIGQLERGMCVRRNNSRPAPRPLHLRPVPVFLPCHLSITCHCVKRACAIQAALTPHLGHCLSHIASIGPIFHPVGSVRCHLSWPAWCTAWNEIWEQLALSLDCNLTSRASSFRSGEAVR